MPFFTVFLNAETPDLETPNPTHEPKDTPQTQATWGKFFCIGIGPYVTKETGDFFALHTSVGIFTHPQEDFQYFLSLDLDYASLSNWHTAETPLAIKTNGNSIDLMFNLGISKKLAFVPWNLRVIPALGLGAGFASIDGGVDAEKILDRSASAFILQPNLTLRSVFAEHHAFDFTIKHDLLTVSNDSNQISASWSFFFSYAFLVF